MRLAIRFVPLLLCLILLSFCSDPVEPVPPNPDPEPDTTSHNWEFTLYEVGEMSTELHDVKALSADYALCVGHIASAYSPRQTNSYMWNGSELIQKSLPIRAAISSNEDTGTVIMPPTSIGKVDALWIFRRDNLWLGTRYGAYSHVTVAGADTMVRNENYEIINDMFPHELWAIDTNDIWFACENGIVLRSYNDVWETHQIHSLNSRSWYNVFWGTDVSSIFSITDDPLGKVFMHHFNGVEWEILYESNVTSLCDTLNFGNPTALWGAPDDDSIWVSGLWLGRMSKKGAKEVTPIRKNRKGYRAADGSAENNMFFVGWDGAILHYNGASVVEYDNFSGSKIIFRAVAVLSRHVFIVGNRPNGSGIFVHGRMQ